MNTTPVALITGAGQGLGRATALRLLEAGAHVVITDLDARLLEETRELSGAPERVAALVQDVTAQDAPAQAVAFALDRFGGLDWLINNAGIGKAKSVAQTSDEEWDRYADINLRSVFRFSREALPHLRPGRGCIVNLASIFGLLGHPGVAPYAATKAALVGLTRQMAVDYGPQGIRVNAVAPGIIETPLTAERIRTDARFKALMIDTTPFHRIGRPEDVANAIHFLCSDQASFISGHTLTVDGGWSVGNYVPTA
ncbi:SDR family oxidoreductase [Pseudomonas sp. RIT-PI-AD]|uniref:SDR family NAD(P)-dependent oxidoreductase n=1 Tax=Pseudomonas sp. RIT-PI-AD TaxID=3035294 RepID=UPI0021DA5AFE|nr:SDR family oxidoreductase [Pseudomonas sp. RIT-PI-AD]